MNKITLIGDVHQKYDKYLPICRDNEHTIQLGDMGYYYQHMSYNLDPNNHKFIGGNHESWDVIGDFSHFLGRFGFSELNGIKFFFVSGGFSIDKKYRMKAYYSGSAPQTYFFNEELSQAEGMQCLELYEKIKPDLVLTHEAPRSITREMFNPEKLRDWGFDPETFTTSTQELLEQMLEIHSPRKWRFAHHHQSKTLIKNGCEFRCLKELETEIIEQIS